MEINASAPSPAHEIARLVEKIKGRRTDLFTKIEVVETIGVAEESCGDRSGLQIVWIARQISDSTYDLYEDFFRLAELPSDGIDAPAQPCGRDDGGMGDERYEPCKLGHPCPACPAQCQRYLASWATAAPNFPQKAKEFSA